jgi:hypothetical protein
MPADSAIEQVFTVSGNIDLFSIARRSGRAIVKVPACDGVLLHVVRPTPDTRHLTPDTLLQCPKS